MHPDVPLDAWRLEIAGAVENPTTLIVGGFLALPQAEDISDFHCVTTWSRFDNRWRGVRFRTIAELVVPKDEARFVLCTGSDFMPGTTVPYTTNLPLARAIEDDVLLVPHMGGPATHPRARRSLPHDHAEAVRLEGREVDSPDRVPARGTQGISGKSAATPTAAEPWFNDSLTQSNRGWGLEAGKNTSLSPAPCVLASSPSRPLVSWP
jgi:hypothetical protein